MHNWWRHSSTTPSTETSTTTTPSAPTSTTPSHYHSTMREIKAIPSHSHPKVKKKLQPTTIATNLAHSCCDSKLCTKDNFTLHEAIEFRQEIMEHAKEGDILEAIKHQLRIFQTTKTQGAIWIIGGKHYELRVFGHPVCPL